MWIDKKALPHPAMKMHVYLGRLIFWSVLQKRKKVIGHLRAGFTGLPL